jgi:hypothetical protein
MILSTFIKQNDWRDFPVQVGMFFLKYITDRNEHDEHMQELMEYKRAIIRAEEDMNKYPELYDQCLDLFDTYRKNIDTNAIVVFQPSCDRCFVVKDRKVVLLDVDQMCSVIGVSRVEDLVSPEDIANDVGFAAVFTC